MLPRLAAIAFLTLSPSALFAFDPVQLGEIWKSEKFVDVPAPCLLPAELAERLGELKKAHPELELEEVGRSVEQRPIYLMQVGHGEKKVLLWSQMHGDEPSATPALLDLTHYLLRHAEEPEVAKILSELTLLMVPMLNPDGAELYTRRNAQGIDINRDARNLATPEGRLLKSLQEKYQPMLGFNLHDQNRRRTVGTSAVLATNAVLAVVGDEAKTLTPGRVLAKRAAVSIAAALEPFAPGGLARYDDTYSPRSFGDNLTGWGTPVVLIESGGLPPGTSLEELTRLNFVALLHSLGELAKDDLAARDPDLYEQIPENNADVYSDVVLRGGKVRQPGIAEAYRADIAFDVKRGDREIAHCLGAGPPRSEIAELGDARIFAAGRELDAAGQIAFPAFALGAEGLGAGKMLTQPDLARLARLGVAKVRWVVAGSDLAAALDVAESMRGAGLARLEVSADRADLPGRVLAAPPAEPASRQLGEIVRVLEEACGKTFDVAGLETSLAALWQGAPPLRYEYGATFLLARAGQKLEAKSELTFVFVDGIEIAGARP